MRRRVQEAAGVAALAGLLACPIALANGPPGVPGQRVSLPAISGPCTAPWLPGLAGSWVVGCGPDGSADRALSLATGEIVTLPEGLDRPSLGPGTLLQKTTGRPEGTLVILEEGAEPTVQTIAMPTSALAAPPMTDGRHVVVLTEDSVQAYPALSKVRKTQSAAPAGWYPPALAWPSVAWVARDQAHGEDIWWMQDASSDPPAQMIQGEGHRHHVVGHGRWLAWVEDGDVRVMKTARPGDTGVHATGVHATVVHKADTGFSAPPSLWRDVACWETREGTDIDIACSDGVSIEAPGHQQWPGRWDRWLVYREGDQVHLYTMNPP